MSIGGNEVTKVLTNQKDVSLSPWTTDLDEHFEVYVHPFNEHINEYESGTTEIINRSPKLLREIEKARESLKHEKLYNDKDIFGT